MPADLSPHGFQLVANLVQSIFLTSGNFCYSWLVGLPWNLALVLNCLLPLPQQE